MGACAQTPLPFCLSDSFVALNGKDDVALAMFLRGQPVSLTLLEDLQIVNFSPLICDPHWFFLIDMSTPLPDHDMSYNTVYGQFTGFVF